MAAAQARTRLARRAVVTAAGELFAEHGFAATTVGAIAERADVPAATLYRLFGSKLGVLRELLDTAIGGDDRPVAVADRPEVGEALAEPDAAAMIAGLAAVTAGIHERTAGAYAALAGAAASDPEAAELLTALTRQRDAGQGRFVRALAGRGLLRDGLAERTAADVVHGLLAPEMYRLLVVDRGWNARRYRDWLAATLVQQLT